MSETSARFNSELLPKFQWESFFNDLITSRKNHPVGLMSGSDFLHTEPPEKDAPLEKIAYDSHHSGRFKHKGLLSISTSGPNGETVAIEGPSTIWVYRELDDTMIAVEIIDEKDNHVVLRFI